MGQVFVLFWDEAAGARATCMVGPFAEVVVDDDRLLAGDLLVAEMLVGGWHLHAGCLPGSRWRGFQVVPRPVEHSCN